MIIIIDAYNVLKQVVHAGHISEIERVRFIKHIGFYGKKKGHTMIVVFDGGSHQRPNQDRMHGVSVVYSGTQQTADTYIQNYIEKHRTLELLLVSSDRQIVRWASDRNVASLEAVDFYRLLQASMKNSKESAFRPPVSSVIKTTGEQATDLDALMYETQVEYKDEGKEEAKLRVSQGYHSTKQERHLIKKIKKL